MKQRPLLVLLLFAGSTLLLIWIYMTLNEPNTPKTPSSRAVTLADLDACGRRKHIKAIQYDHFARLAEREHQTRTARLFHALAHSERIQENNCARAILRLGGSYTPSTKIYLFGSTTTDNLTRSITYERQLLEDNVRAEIDRAVAAGNRYAARILCWARAGDLQHVILMERIQHTQPPATVIYLVCPVCGNLYASDYANPYCPHCLTDGRRFVRIE